MKSLITLIALCLCVGAFAQPHDMKTADAMKLVAFMEGDWKGKHIFNAPTPTELDAVAQIHGAIGGKYLEDVITTTLQSGKLSDVRHLLTFDPTDQKFHAWWFNNTAAAPNELVGSLADNKLVLESKPGQGGAPIRATYEKFSETKLGYKVEAKLDGDWRELLHTVFSK